MSGRLPMTGAGGGCAPSAPGRLRGARRVPAALRFAAGQLARFALLMVAVSMVTVALVSASPIDPVQANTGQAALLSMSAEKREELAERWGAGEPFAERYAAWASDALHGDLGESLRFNAPVVEVVGERLAGSALLLACAWLLSGAIGFALGVAAGAAQGSLFDRLVRGWCYLLSATPGFWLAMLALMAFSVWLGWFPVGFSVPIGASSASVTLLDRIHHAALPALVLSLTGVANVALHTREKTVDVMASEYMRFAEARGETRRRAVLRHGLRNLALPALTLQFTSVSEIVGGSVLVEQVFSYPGLGQAAVTAGLGGDAPLLVGIALATSAIVFAGNLAANLLYGAVDPRMRAVGGAGAVRGADEGAGAGAGGSAAGAGAAAGCSAAGAGAAPSRPVPEGAAAAGRSGGVVAAACDGATAPVAAASGPLKGGRRSVAVPDSVGAGAAPSAGGRSAEGPDPVAAEASRSLEGGSSAGAPVPGGVPTRLHAPRPRGLLGGRRALLAGALVALAVLVAAVVAGALSAERASATDFTATNLAPCLEHPFGTDWMGRDMLARTLAGLSTSVVVGAVSAAVSSVIALVLAAASALGGPRVDAVVGWLIDLIMGVPHIVLLILVSYALGRGAAGVCVGVALTHWPSLTRVLRAEIMQLRAQPFMACSRALGVSGVRLALTHALPCVLPQYLVGLVLLFPHAILHEASITFLGFGLSPEQPAIGVILSEAMGYLTSGAWWLAVFPGAALLAVVLMFDRVGSALRRLLSVEGVQA